MDLTTQFIKYHFGQISRNEIVEYVDSRIIEGMRLSDDTLDLSMSTGMDDFAFEKILLKFVHFPIPEEIVRNVVIFGLKRIVGLQDMGLIHGLMIARNNWDLDDKYSDLYYNLDHYINDEPQFTDPEIIHGGLGGSMTKGL